MLASEQFENLDVHHAIMLINFEDKIMLERKRDYYVVIERDEDGIYVGEVPQLRGCYSQGTTIDELMQNMCEVIALCLEELADTQGT